MPLKWTYAIFSCYGIFFLSISCSADSTKSVNLFGLDKYLLPSYEISLSPAIVDNYIQLGIFEHLYELKQPLEKGSPALASEAVIQKDPVLKLIDSLFYVVPGGDSTLRLPENGQLFGSHLKESTVGKILNELLLPPKTDLELEKNKAKLIHIIEDDILPPGYLEKVAQQLDEDLKPYAQMSQIQTKKEDLVVRLRKIYEKYGGGIEGLWEQQKELDREMGPFIEEATKIKRKAEKDSLKQKTLRDLARKLYQAQHQDEVPTHLNEAESWPADEVLAPLEEQGIKSISSALIKLDQKMKVSLDEKEKKEWQKTYDELVKHCRVVAESLKDLSYQAENLQKSLAMIQAKFEKEKGPSLEEREHRLKILLKANENIKLNLQPYKANAFVDSLIAAIKESRNPNSNYSENFVYHMLLGQAMVKSKGYRATLLEIWKQMPAVLSKEGLNLLRPKPPTPAELLNAKLNGQSRKDLIQKSLSEHKKVIHEFLSEQFTPEEQLSSKDLFEKLGNHRKISALSLDIQEKTAYELTKDPNRSLPALAKNKNRFFTPKVIFNQALKNVSFKVGGSGPEVSSSDCCEASFLTTILRFILKNESSKDPFRIPSTARKEFVEYFTRDPLEQVLDPKNLERRSRWKELTSNLPKLQYFQDIKTQDKTWSFDLRPSVDNLIEIMARFFNLEPETSHKMTRVERLKFFASQFNYEVKIDPESEPDDNQPWNNVRLSFNEKGNEYADKFSVDISPLHCWVYQPDFSNPLGNYLELYFYYQLTRGEVADVYQSLESASSYDEHIHNLNERHRQKRYPKNMSKSELESFFHISSASLINTVPDTFGALASGISKDSPNAKKYLLPLIVSQQGDQLNRGTQWVSHIFEQGLESYFPMALKYLNSVSLDPYSIFRLSDTLKPFLRIKENRLDIKFPDKFIDDLKILTRKILLSKENLTDIAIKESRKGVHQEESTRIWISQMKSYFQNHPENRTGHE